MNKTTVILLLTGFAACSPDFKQVKQPDTSSPDPKAKVADVVKFSQVKKVLDDNHCTLCHQPPKPAHNIDLTTSQAISQNTRLINVAQPGSSLLVAAISGPTPDMPPAKKFTPIPQDGVDLITKWITQGAKDDGAAAAVLEAPQ